MNGPHPDVKPWLVGSSWAEPKLMHHLAALVQDGDRWEAANLRTRLLAMYPSGSDEQPRRSKADVLSGWLDHLEPTWAPNHQGVASAYQRALSDTARRIALSSFWDNLALWSAADHARGEVASNSAFFGAVQVGMLATTPWDVEHFAPKNPAVIDGQHRFVAYRRELRLSERQRREILDEILAGARTLDPSDESALRDLTQRFLDLVYARARLRTRGAIPDLALAPTACERIHRFELLTGVSPPDGRFVPCPAETRPPPIPETNREPSHFRWAPARDPSDRRLSLPSARDPSSRRPHGPAPSGCRGLDRRLLARRAAARRPLRVACPRPVGPGFRMEPGRPGARPGARAHLKAVRYGV